MKITINPKDAAKQITFNDVEEYWTDNNNWLVITHDNGDVVNYRLTDVEFYRIHD
jgi:hypothetical protein